MTWEGRRRPFDLTLDRHRRAADGRVLDALADELDVDLSACPAVAAARAELAALRRSAAGRRRRPCRRRGRRPRRLAGEAVLATGTS